MRSSKRRCSFETREAQVISSNEDLRREIAKRPRAEKAFRYRGKFERLIARMSANFINLSPEDVDEMMNHALEKIGRFTGIDRIRVFQFVEDGQKAHKTHEWRAESTELHAPDLAEITKNDESHAPVNSANEAEHSRVPPSADSSGAEKRHFEIQDAQSSVVVPLTCGRSTTGFMKLDSARRGEAWSEQIIPQLKIVGKVFAEALARKRAEKRLQESEEKYRRLFENLNDAAFLADVETGILLDANTQAEVLLGRTRDEIIGMHQSQLHPPEQVDKYCQMFATHIERGRDIDFDADVLRKDGRVVPVIISAAAMTINGKRVLLGLFRDVTNLKRAEEERVRLESELRQAHKLEAVGTLAAGIAHEINTPTQYVGHNTRFLKDGFADLLELLTKYERLLAAVKQGDISPELVAEVETAAEKADLEYMAKEIPQAIEQSLEGIDRVSKMVRAMKEFSHPGGEEKTAIDINRAIENAVTVARNEWKYVAEMITELDEALPLVPCLPADLNQVILNLIVNAAHAIADAVGDGPKGKGTITVATRRNNGWAEIHVSDTGTGIPEDIRDRIFDPFFTTKGVGKGTGQGLAIARSIIVDKHGGRIDFETQDGQGTTVSVRLPIQSEVPKEKTEMSDA